MTKLLWQYCFRPALFLLEAERAHELAMGTFSRLMSIPLLGGLIRARYRLQDPRLKVERFGLSFPSPVGLAAGFDKNAQWYNPLSDLGFGFIEVGTVTPVGQPGNPRPRLFRLPKDQALINRMGFNNRGSRRIARALKGKAIRPVLGINIGRGKKTPNEMATEDYCQCLSDLFDYAAYVTVNVSSPNTQGLRDLQELGSLRKLLQAVQQRNQDLARERSAQPRPLLLKIAPDMTSDQLNGIAELCQEEKISGLIATNTTISRENLETRESKIKKIGNGGLSGRPLTERSRRVVAHLYRTTDGKLPLMGVGGILSGEDAWEMLRAGASLIQVYTGFIYQGPGFARSIHQYIQKRLDESGKQSVEQIIGENANGIAPVSFEPSVQA